jgi:nucleoside-diphosphate-sugar epimerase
MDVLVLGGGGFIGSHLVDRMLRSTSHQVIVYDLWDDKLETSVDHSRLTFVRGDIRNDHAQLDRLVRDTDLTVDLIAHANPSLYVDIPLDVVQLNFHENLVIAESCVRHFKRLIQFSTCEVYGKTVVPVLGDLLSDPENPAYAEFEEETTHMILGPVNKHRWIYACAKQLLERILHAYGLQEALEYSIIRPFNFIGPRIDYLASEQDGNPRVFSHFLQSLKDGSPMQLVNGGRQQRCYTHIEDAVDCIFRIIENPVASKNQIFNIGSPENEASIRDLAIKMRDIYQRRWWDGHSQLPELVEISGDDFYGEGYDDSDRRIPNIQKARTLLGWEPKLNLEQTIEQSMEYWFTDPAAGDRDATKQSATV